MKSIEEVKAYEGRLKELAEQVTEIAEELGMSVSIDSILCDSGFIATNIGFYGETGAKEWYKCHHIVTRNADGFEPVWESIEYKNKEDE